MKVSVHKGDKVRITYEGTVSQLLEDGGVRTTDNINHRGFEISKATVEVLTPAEPPVGSIVVFGPNFAWTHGSLGWRHPFHPIQTWDWVVDNYKDLYKPTILRYGQDIIKEDEQ